MISMDFQGPYERYTLIFCRSDELGSAKRAAFQDDVEALEHARVRLLASPPEWISVVVARGIDDDGALLEFLGSWERDVEGALRWDAASLG